MADKGVEMIGISDVKWLWIEDRVHCSESANML